MAAENDERRALRAAVAALPGDLQRYLSLRYGGDRILSQKDAGRVLGWSQAKACRREQVVLRTCRAVLDGAEAKRERTV